MSRRKPRSTFDQESKFKRGMIVAFRDCGLSFREIGCRVARNQTNLMRICGRCMHAGGYDRPTWSIAFTSVHPIENMWSMFAQRLTQIIPPAATPDQLWQRVEVAWSVVPQEHIQSLFESLPRCVAAVISINGGYSGY
ncbi:transposable element Tcb1 transposase [Trichonephila clavipes]|nr:transposable element Tcb1 transposase [Trichonephila clavipes]